MLFSRGFFPCAASRAIGSLRAFAVAAAAVAILPTHAGADDARAIVRSKLPADYETRAGCDKATFLWNDRIVPTAWATLPSLSRFELSRLTGLALKPSFDRVSDEFPSPREKLFHSYGSVARIAFVPADSNPYGGLFEGACGLLRLSLAADPKAAGFVPGASIKLFVDARPSENLQFMGGLDAQEDPNFFLTEWSNRLPAPKSGAFKAIVKIFSLTGLDPLHVGVEPLFRVDARGAVQTDVRAPDDLVFVPTDALRAERIGATEDVRMGLGRLPEGTVLWNVYGIDTETGERTLAGTIVTQTPFVASEYGDRKLFFRHNPMPARPANPGNLR